MARLTATTFPAIDALLRGGRDKIGHNTTARHEGGDILVTLHCSDIVRLTPTGEVFVNLHGWHTITTRDRLNQFVAANFRSDGNRGTIMTRVESDGTVKVRPIGAGWHLVATATGPQF